MLRVKSNRSKYGAARTSCGEHNHASKKEARRCGELRLLNQAGEIIDLKQQPVYEMHGVTYRADFEYEERSKDGAWTLVVEDCKGFRTPVYRLKKTLMKNVCGIEIRET